MKQNKIILYAHGGSSNHGCEAIVRSTVKILNTTSGFILFSNHPKQDIKYGINRLVEIKSAYNAIKKNAIQYFFFLLKMKILKKDYHYYKEKYRDIPSKSEDAEIALSIGGDNYCYEGYQQELQAINEKFFSRNIKTVLWGCSVEPKVLTEDLIKHLQQYTTIVARESITYKALQEVGCQNLHLFPDPAFQLSKEAISLPENFDERNTVGLNLSPLIFKYQKNKDIIHENVKQLIRYILEKTPYNIALIPHVVWENNDDRIPLQKIQEEFKHSHRIFLVEDANAMQLKFIISKCRFMIAARTHASIAAYSQHIPTLVLGYSVKAKGIAQDLFGTFENYVVPVQDLQNENQFVNAFQFIEKNELNILNHYKKVMPNYKNKALQSMSVIQNL